MKARRATLILTSLLAVMTVLSVSQYKRNRARDEMTVRFGLSPYPNTFIPIIGKEKGWYADEGVSVEFTTLAWPDVISALSANRVDVAISTISSIIGEDGG